MLSLNQKLNNVMENHQDEFKEKQEQINVVVELKSQLQNEINSNKELRENILFLQSKYKQDLDFLSSENKELKNLVEILNSEFEKLVLENSNLSRQLVFAGKIVEQNEEKREEVEKNLVHVRELVKLFMTEEDSKKKKDIREQNFWQLLGKRESLIKASEPRDNYPYPEISLTKEKLISWKEHEKVLNELKTKNAELKKLHSSLTKSQDEEKRLKKELQSLGSKVTDDVENLKEQLKSSVRRINYLVEEKEKMIDEAKQKNSYISKLEIKIVSVQLTLTKQNKKTDNSTSRGTTPVAHRKNKETANVPRILMFENQSAKRSDNGQDGLDVSPRVTTGREAANTLRPMISDELDELQERLKSKYINYKFEDSPQGKGQRQN